MENGHSIVLNTRQEKRRADKSGANERIQAEGREENKKEDKQRQEEVDD